MFYTLTAIKAGYGLSMKDIHTKLQNIDPFPHWPLNNACRP